MSKNSRGRRPYIKPVTQITLSSENFVLRWILVVVLLCVAAVCLVSGINSILETESGWKQIEVSSDQVNCGMDFQLYYDLGHTETTATMENKALTTLYSTATVDAYKIFSAYFEEQGVNNVKYLNDHPNEVVRVEPALYKALEQLNRYENRNIFMAPVNSEYNHIFTASSDVQAAELDPAKNDEVKAYLAEIASYVNNPEMIDIELMEDDQVRLNISREYLNYAAEQEITKYIDFSWMTNAFIIDYMADVLAENGYTNGYLVSYDGFIRNLDQDGESYSLNIYDYLDGTVYFPAVMEYSKPISIVRLRSYPMVEEDQWHYYRYENGDSVSIFADPADGISKCATDDLVGYSYDSGCAETLMQLIPQFVADDFDVAKLNALVEKGTFAIWSDNLDLCHNDGNLSLTLNEEESGYSIVYSGK